MPGRQPRKSRRGQGKRVMPERDPSLMVPALPLDAGTENSPVYTPAKCITEKPVWSEKERELFSRVQRFVDGMDEKEQALDLPARSAYERKKEMPAEGNEPCRKSRLPQLPRLWKSAAPKDPELMAMKEEILRTVNNNDSAD